MLTAEEIKEANIAYHDAAAEEYDGKWGIDYGELGNGQVLTKAKKVLGRNPGHYARGLEIGAGTGYFGMNLALTGVIGEVVASDISEGMLKVIENTAAELNLSDRVSTVHTEAEQMPFEDNSFDIIFGHAVLHHLPHLEDSFAEFMRILKPGGVIAFFGEPSRIGDSLARYPKGFAMKTAPLWRKALKIREPEPVAYAEDDGHSVEHLVDVHAFIPEDLEQIAKGAGFEEVRIIGEELLASWFGWTNRTLETQGRQEDIPNGWRQFAYKGYLAMQRVDRVALEGRLPAKIFYNLLLGARKPA
ncbi:MAG: methyltransferase domain-containing protein [Thermoleophilaceae bacterium]|nr:methyltransferase domain-containing protein [Thermoleophilaceae bacterium]